MAPIFLCGLCKSFYTCFMDLKRWFLLFTHSSKDVKQYFCIRICVLLKFSPKKEKEFNLVNKLMAVVSAYFILSCGLENNTWFSSVLSRVWSPGGHTRR